MALADQLSFDRVRARTLGALRGGSRFGGRFVARAVAGSGSGVTAAASVGFATVVVPWLVVVVARALDPELGRGVIVADPWSLLSPSWGAWALVGLLVVAAGTLVAWARLRLPAPDLSRTSVVALASLLAFVAWCGASVFLWSTSPSGAWRWTVMGLVLVVSTVLGLFAGAQAPGRRGLVFGVIAVGAGTAIIGLVDLLAFPGTARRIVAPLDPTATGALIALSVLAALALDQGEHPQRRRWLRGAATLGLIAVVLSASRGAVGITVLGLVLLGVRGVPVGWPLLQALAGALPAIVTALVGGGVVRAGAADPTGRVLVAALAVGGVALVAWSAARDVGAPASLRRWVADRRVQVLAAIALFGIVVGLLSLATADSRARGTARARPSRRARCRGRRRTLSGCGRAPAMVGCGAGRRPWMPTSRAVIRYAAWDRARARRCCASTVATPRRA